MNWAGPPVSAWPTLLNPQPGPPSTPHHAHAWLLPHAPTVTSLVRRRRPACHPRDPTTVAWLQKLLPRHYARSPSPSISPLPSPKAELPPCADGALTTSLLFSHRCRARGETHRRVARVLHLTASLVRSLVPFLSWPHLVQRCYAPVLSFAWGNRAAKPPPP
jgi:hypothetical protein